jgi:membrane protein YqaA with SNARE-associated domain
VLLKALVLHLASFLASLGALGLFLFGIIDSSFFFLPLGIDLLLVALTARHHDRMLLYAAMCAAGSVIGCFTTDWLSRKGGEAGLEGRVSPRRLAYVQKQVTKHGGVALALASMMPPGFPFTIVVVVAAALKYPRAKLLSIVAVFRFIRFAIEGLLAIWFGRRILKMAELPAVQWAIFVIVVVSVVGSAWSIYGWFIKSKRLQLPKQ